MNHPPLKLEGNSIGLAAIFRRKAAEEQKGIERKVEARRQAVLQQYENCKNQPGQQKRKEIKQIDEITGPDPSISGVGTRVNHPASGSDCRRCRRPNRPRTTCANLHPNRWNKLSTPSTA